MIAKKFSYKKLIIPDQGGWFSYRKLPKKLGIEFEEIKTDYGLILPEELKKYKDCAFIFTTLAGYFAEQPLLQINSICKKNKILLIEDITGSIGWKKSKADLTVCSFSDWKPINLGYGGFIGSKERKYFEVDEIKAFLERNSFAREEMMPELLKRIDGLGRRSRFLFKNQKKVKKELRGFDVIHRRMNGINVVARYKNEEEKEKLINYCKKNDYETVNCPNYIKVNDAAISIELKRLEEGVKAKSETSFHDLKADANPAQEVQEKQEEKNDTVK